jgi:hypothetical protein
VVVLGLTAAITLFIGVAVPGGRSISFIVVLASVVVACVVLCWAVARAESRWRQSLVARAENAQTSLQPVAAAAEAVRGVVVAVAEPRFPPFIWQRSEKDRDVRVKVASQSFVVATKDGLRWIDTPFIVPVASSCQSRCSVQGAISIRGGESADEMAPPWADLATRGGYRSRRILKIVATAERPLEIVVAHADDCAFGRHCRGGMGSTHYERLSTA